MKQMKEDSEKEEREQHRRERARFYEWFNDQLRMMERPGVRGKVRSSYGDSLCNEQEVKPIEKELHNVMESRTNESEDQDIRDEMK